MKMEMKMKIRSMVTLTLVGAIALTAMPRASWGFQSRDSTADTTTPPLAKIYDSTVSLSRLQKKLPRAQFVKRSKEMALLVDKVISGVSILQWRAKGHITRQMFADAEKMAEACWQASSPPRFCR